MAALWWVMMLLAVPACLAAPADLDADDTGEVYATPTIPTPPTPPTTEGSVVEVQEQIYIVSGVLGVFLLVLLVVSMAAAYTALTLRNKLRALQTEPAPKARPSTVRRPAAPASAPAARGPRARPPPKQLGRNNDGYAEDDDEVSGDEVQERYDQYPDHPSDRGHGRGGGGAPAREHDRFHQPMPDQRMPSEERRPQHHDSRYGAGNLSRLPKGPAPGPPDYYRGNSVEGRAPRHGQW